MILTISITHIPSSNDVVVLFGMFLTPSMLSGGGSVLA